MSGHEEMRCIARRICASEMSRAAVTCLPMDMSVCITEVYALWCAYSEANDMKPGGTAERRKASAGDGVASSDATIAKRRLSATMTFSMRSPHSDTMRETNALA